MYPNVEADKARNKVTLAMIAEAINCTVSTASLKLTGKAPITFKEAVAIKKVIKSDLPLEDLFEEVEE